MMNFIDEKKRILIFTVLLIFLFIVLYIAVSYYGRLESIRTGNVDIFNIENINKDKVDNDDKKLSSKSNIFKNNISDEGNFNSKNNKSDYKKIIKKSKFYKNYDKRIRSNNIIVSNNVGVNIQDDYYKNEVLENTPALKEIIVQSIDLPLPVFTAALTYINQLSSVCLGANIIQGQRDFFGAHTYQRVDREGFEHHQWGSHE